MAERGMTSAGGLLLGGILVGSLVGYLLSRSQAALAAPRVPEIHRRIIDRLRITDGEVEALTPELLDVGWEDRPHEPRATHTLWAFTQTGVVVVDTVEVAMESNCEAVVDIWGTVLPISVDVAKMTGNPILVYFDEELMIEFPEGVPEGFGGFVVREAAVSQGTV